MGQIANKQSARLKTNRKGPLRTPTDLGEATVKDISAAMNGLFADVFWLCFKTKKLHWHMSESHFHDCQAMFGHQADQILAMIEPLAERVRKVGATTLRSIGQIARLQRIPDNDADYVDPSDMLAELRDDNRVLTTRMREAHELREEHRDIASTGIIKVWIDESERRTWFLFESGRWPDSGG